MGLDGVISDLEAAKADYQDRVNELEAELRRMADAISRLDKALGILYDLTDDHDDDDPMWCKPCRRPFKSPAGKAAHDVFKHQRAPQPFPQDPVREIGVEVRESGPLDRETDTPIRERTRLGDEVLARAAQLAAKPAEPKPGEPGWSLVDQLEGGDPCEPAADPVLDFLARPPTVEVDENGMVKGLPWGCSCFARFPERADWARHLGEQKPSDRRKHRLVDQPKATMVDTGLPHPKPRIEPLPERVAALQGHEKVVSHREDVGAIG